MFGDEVVFEYVVRGFLLFDLFLNQVLATTSGKDGWSPTYQAGRVKVIGRLINLTPFGLAALKVFSFDVCSDSGSI